MFVIATTNDEGMTGIFPTAYPTMEDAISAVEDDRNSRGFSDEELDEQGGVWEEECKTDSYARFCASGEDWTYYYVVQEVKIAK